MSYGEREALTGLLTTLLVIALFLWRLGGLHAGGAFDDPAGLQIWARAVLVLIGISLGLAIATAILAHVAHAVLTGERHDDRRDERDYLIDRRALTWAWYLLSFGLMGMIVDLALGASALRAVNTVLALCLGTEAFKDGLKVWLYRRGA